VRRNYQEIYTGDTEFSRGLVDDLRTQGNGSRKPPSEMPVE